MNPTLTTVPSTETAETADPTEGTTEPTPTEGTASDSNTDSSTVGTDTGNTTESVNTTTTTVDPDTTAPPETTVDPSDTDSDTEGPPPCVEMEATLMPVPPNIMLVLDKSGSMVNNKWDHDNDGATPTITRWMSLYNVVESIVTANDAKINFGATLFPSKSAKAEYTNKGCLVNADPEVDVAPGTGAAILGVMPPADADNTLVAGGTPTTRGMTAALNHLATLDPSVPQAVLLVTDGAANCPIEWDPNDLSTLFEVYDENLQPLVADAFANGIPTYVIGIDIKNMILNPPQEPDGNPNGINPYEKLNLLAQAGGKPKNDPNEQFYNSVNQQELQDALDVIVADALSCTIQLDSEPGSPDKTEVKIDGALIPKIEDCATEDGWTYTNPAGPFDAVVLCGTACNQLKTIGAADVNFFCDAG